jgi:hypothetical protein
VLEGVTGRLSRCEYKTKIEREGNAIGMNILDEQARWPLESVGLACSLLECIPSALAWR